MAEISKGLELISIARTSLRIFTVHYRTGAVIEMLFGSWTRMGPRKHVLGGGADWYDLANTIELSMCDSNAACCQITLTTCFCKKLIIWGWLKGVDFDGFFVRMDQLEDIREKCFMQSSVSDLFESTDNHDIIGFVKETHFYHLLRCLLVHFYIISFIALVLHCSFVIC